MSEKIIVEIDPDLEELIPGFLENRKKDVDALNAAVNAGDFDTLRSTGHSLKGVGGGYGFATITDIGGDIEAAAKVQDMDSIKDLIGRLADYLERVEVVYQ